MGAAKGGQGEVMTRVAVAAVAISVAVMVVSLAVIGGFRKQITASLTGFAAHVQIVNPLNANALETTPIERDPQLEAQIASLPQCSRIYPFAVKGGIMKTADAIQGIMLKGLDADYDWSFFQKNLTEGRLPVVSDTASAREILISRSLADAMGLAVDDRVEMLFIRDGDAPRRDRFKITGIYSTGFEELDRTVVPTSLRNVQRLGNWNRAQVSGYEAVADDMDHIADLQRGIADAIREGERRGGQMMVCFDLRSRFPGLFDWLQAHNVNAAVIITIMLLVALLNMISALLIILLSRTQMIGVLKSLGMRNAPLQRIFMLRSARIVLKGMAWGNAAGLALCAVQAIWHPVKLDRTGYFLSEVPIALGWQWWTVLNVGAFGVILAAMALPTMIISYMRPDTTLRFR